MWKHVGSGERGLTTAYDNNTLNRFTIAVKLLTHSFLVVCLQKRGCVCNKRAERMGDKIWLGVGLCKAHKRP